MPAIRRARARVQRNGKSVAEAMRAHAFDMEVPMTQAIELVRAIEMIGNGMEADRNDEGRPIATVARAASERLHDMKRHWLGVLKAARRGRTA